MAPTYIASIPVPPDVNGQYTVTKTANGVSIGYDSAGNTSAIIAGSNPSLDINFARDKMLFNSTGSIPINFTRLSPGTYVGADRLLKTAAANEPRFDHNPITGESLGLLVEEQRTNNYFESENIAGTSVFQGSTSNLNITTAPDGSQTADKLIGNAGQTGRQSVYKTPILNAGTTYTFSVYLKAAERTFATIWFDSANITEGPFWGASGWLDLSTGVSTNTAHAKIIPAGNGWYRAFVIATPTGTGAYNLQVAIGTPNNLADTGAPAQMKYTGDGSSGIFVWGGQIEVGNSITSYYHNPNTTGFTTRAVDATNITGANFNAFYTQGPGSLYTEAYVSLGIDQQYVSISQDGTFNLRSRKNASNNYIFVARDGVTRDIGQTPVPSLINNQLIKIAAAYNTNDLALSGGGQAAVTGSTIVLGTNNRLDIGSYGGIGAPCPSCTIRRVTYWATRLNNTILSNLSR